METFVPAGQLYGPILPAFIMNRAISLGAKIAYAFLCDFAGKKDHCWPAQKTLASRMGCSLSSIKVYLGELQKENLISVSRKGFSVSVYTLLKPSPEFDHPQPESGYRTNLKNFKKEESPLPPKRSQSRAAAGGRKGGDFCLSNLRFETLWSAYPRKEAKELARAAWHTLRRRGRLPSLDVLIEAVNRFKASAMWLKEHGRFVPYLATWLKGQRWLDSDLAMPPKAYDAQLKEELAMRRAKVEEAEQRRKAEYEREAEPLRPAFEAFLACFPDGESKRGPAWGLWCLLHRKGSAPSVADVSDTDSGVLHFLKNFQWKCRDRSF